MSSASDALRTVLDEIEIRQQIELCVKEMVTDVECAHQLSAQLQHERERQAWEQQNAAQQQALHESYLERQKLKQESLPVADGLVRDLYKTSRELGKFYQLQTKHDTLTHEYDELLAKLLQAEDQIRLLEEEKEQAFRNATTRQSTSATATIQEAAEKDLADEKSAHDEPKEEEKVETKPEIETTVAPPVITPTETAEGQSESVGATVDTTTKDPVPVAEEKEEKEEEAPASDEPAAAAVVVSLEAEAADSDDDLHLADFEDAILMNIFAFLDALEILNTAQINTKMYNRVDALFGLGDGGTDNTTIATDEGSTAASTTQAAVTTATSSSSTTGTTTTSSVTKMDNQKHPPRSNSMDDSLSTATGPTTTATPFTPSRDTRATNAPSLTNSTQQQASAVMNNVFQMFQPRRTGSTTPTRRNPGSSSSSPIMNAATASSVASKLTDSELNAILGMMERMRQKEAAVERLKAENERLKAEFEGTQSVKDFLIQKVRNMEELLTHQEDNETKVAQQIASDQEVIAFLDARVQELERQLASLHASQAELGTDREKLRANLEQKTTVLQDMLQFERERFVEFERDAKSTKKVLVKEIKLCRNQIVALTAERNALKEQNQTLQKAVLRTVGSDVGNMGERIYA